MYFPNRISISKNAANKFQTIKKNTGLTPNILSRVAIMLAINSKADIVPVGTNESGGQELNRDTLFGDHTDTYEILVRQHLHDKDNSLDVGVAITALVEMGAHKMGHVRSLEQLVEVK